MSYSRENSSVLTRCNGLFHYFWCSELYLIAVVVSCRVVSDSLKRKRTGKQTLSWPVTDVKRSKWFLSVAEIYEA
jgi:hypothetical protein